MNKLVVVVASVLFLFACKQQTTNNKQQIITQSNNYSVFEDFDSTDVSNKWAKEMEDTTFLEIDKTFGKMGNGAQIVLPPYEGKKKKFSLRSELNLQVFEDTLNVEKYYQWEFKIPSNQSLDSINMGRITMIAQIHSRPEKGKDWKHYKKNNPFNRPSVGLYYTEREDGYYLLAFYGLNGKPDTKFEGLRWKKIVEHKINADTWYKMNLNIKYEFDDSGHISFFLNDSPITEFNGKDYKVYGGNIHNSAPNYFKFGLYRPWKNSTTQRIYFDNFISSFEPINNKI